MENLKVRVNSREEQEVARDLLESVGYPKDFICTENEYPRFVIIQDGRSTGAGIFYDGGEEEITLPELRILVGLKKNPSVEPVITGIGLADSVKHWEKVREMKEYINKTTGEYRKTSEPKGLKFDSNKPRFSLLPKGSVNSVIDVLEFGARKYEANNWQKVDNAKERYYNAAMRHIDSWWNGEKTDQETGIHHLAHAATNLFFLIWFDEQENKNG